METAAAVDAAVVIPIGERDLVTVGPVEQALMELEDTGTARLVLDLHRLSFMDRSGLHVLLRARARSRHTGTRLELACGPGQVKRLLELTGLDREFEIAELPTSLSPIDGGLRA